MKMRIAHPALFVLLALAAPAAVAQIPQQGQDQEGAFGGPDGQDAVAAGQPEQEQEIVVSAAAARAEIERILQEDNLGARRLSPRETAETMAGIARGRAPQDFWAAYQLHVQAWQAYAAAVETGQQQQGESTFGFNGDATAAEQAITTTFNEVERIARRYGARLPAPPVNPLEIA
jgi:hypothetical protein